MRIPSLYPNSSFIVAMGHNISLIVSSSSYVSTIRSNPFLTSVNRMTTQ